MAQHRIPHMPRQSGGFGWLALTLAVLVAVGTVNYLSARYLNFPFAWCWGRTAIHAMGVSAWYQFATTGVILFMLIVGFAKGWQYIIKPALLLLLLASLPGWAEIAFRHGQFCSDAERQAYQQQLDQLQMKQRADEMRRQLKQQPQPKQDPAKAKDPWQGLR